MRSQRGMFLNRGGVLAAMTVCTLLAVSGCGGGGGGVTIVPGPPAAPSAMTVTLDPANNRVVVRWNISSGATNYKIFRDPPLPVVSGLAKPRAGTNAPVLGASSAQAEYDDRAVQDGVTYTYQVAASNASGDSSKTDPISVTYIATPSITVNPAAPSLLPGGAVTFSAAVFGIPVSNGSNPNAVTWSVQEGPQGGTIDAAGHYTAPSAVGTYHVVAISQADPTKQAIATVIVGKSNGSTTITVR